MTNIYVSNASQLQSALANAKGGDTLLLKSGNYGSIKIEDANFNDFVTIKSADGDNRATFSGLDVFDSSYLRIDGVHVAATSNSGTSVLHIDNSDHIDLVNSEVNGKVDNVYPIEGPAFGIYVYNGSTNIRLENNYVHDVQNGVVVFGATNAVVEGNKVDRIGADTFKFSNLDGALIKNNIGPEYLYPGDDTHADFMQFQGSPSKNVVIEGNVFLPQNRFDSQGIFVAGAGGHKNITIEQNIIYTKMANGIFVNTSSTLASTITIKENTLINALSDDRPSTRISVPDGAKVTNNIVSRKSGEYDGNNLRIQHTDPGGDYYYGDLFANLLGKPGVKLADLAPVPGSVADGMGAYDRLLELLGEKPASGPDPDPEPVFAPDPDPAPDPEPAPDPDPEPVPDPNPKPGPTPEDIDAIYANLPVQNIARASNVIELKHSSDFEVAAATIALSFNADSVSGRLGLVSKDATGYGGGGNHITAYIDDGELIVRFQNGNNDKTFTIPGIEVGKDYDLQLSFGEGAVSVWLNGQPVKAASFNMSWEDNVEYFQIGGNGWASVSGEAGFTHVFDGKIWDVVIVEGVKSPEKISDILNGTSQNTTSAQTLFPDMGDIDWDTLNVLTQDGGGIIEGTEKADYFGGTNVRDVVLGDKGGDILVGGGGNDSLKGNYGSDILAGGNGGDSLRGGRGEDILAGGAGNDYMNGGADADMFHFAEMGKDNSDFIKNFKTGSDQIGLDGDVFKNIDDPSDAFIAGTKALSAGDHLIYDEQTGKLFYDRDGSGSTNKRLVAEFEVGTDLTGDDFSIL